MKNKIMHSINGTNYSCAFIKVHEIPKGIMHLQITPTLLYTVRGIVKMSYSNGQVL